VSIFVVHLPWYINRVNVLTLFLYFIFVHATLLIPGYVAVTRSGIAKNNPGAILSLSYLVSIVVFATISVASYLFKLPPVLDQVMVWIWLVATFLLFFKQKMYKTLLVQWFPLAALLLTTVLSLAFMALTFSSDFKYNPDPSVRGDRNYNVLNVKVLNVAQTNANDNYVPYRQAQFFVNESDPGKDSFIDEWGVHFFQRTPLMGAVTASYLTALNDRTPIDYSWSNTAKDTDNTYAKFQIIAQTLNAIFIIPAFYLIWKFFGKKAATISTFFIIPSQFFLYNSIFTWPKSLVAFFILLTWLMLREKELRYVILAGIASGLAYLAHDLAVLYIGATAFVLITQRRWKFLLAYVGTTTLFMLPWLFISSFIYKKPSSFIYYPISTQGIPQPSEKSKIVDTFLHTNPLRLIQIRLESLYYLLSPYQLLNSEGGQPADRRLWALGLYTIPGSLGLGLVIPTLMSFFGKHRKKIELYILILGPVLLCVAMIGWPKGLGSLHFAQALVVLLFGLGCSWLADQKRWIVLTSYFISSLQLVFFIIFSYRANPVVWLGTPRDTIICATIVGIIGLCGFGLYTLTVPDTKKSSDFLSKIK